MNAKIKKIVKKQVTDLMSDDPTLTRLEALTMALSINLLTDSSTTAQEIEKERIAKNEAGEQEPLPPKTIIP